MAEVFGDSFATSRAWMVPYAIALAFMLIGLVSVGLKSPLLRLATFTAAIVTLLTVILWSLPSRTTSFEREFEVVWASSSTIAAAVAILFIGGRVSAVLLLLIALGFMIVQVAHLDTRSRWLFLSLVTAMSSSAIALLL